jgi:Putative auto-transporter adhesin, head GIN domain
LFGLSGGSTITLSGSAPAVSTDVSGGSGIDLRDFAAGRLKASMSGGARAKVEVSGSPDASLSGGSDLEYFGSPALGDVSTSGGSHVRRGGSL